MHYEVEQKFAIADVAGLLEKLANLGVTLGSPVAQCDHYFNHPARDFAKTDEALRLRQSGSRSYVTYKGPKIDATTKTRQEIELPLPEGAAEGNAWPGLLAALGFRSVANVHKRRRSGRWPREGFDCDIVVDEVEGLGTYCELEISADEHALAEAKRCLHAAAAELELQHVERRSYLELLMARKS